LANGFLSYFDKMTKGVIHRLLGWEYLRHLGAEENQIGSSPISFQILTPNPLA